MTDYHAVLRITEEEMWGIEHDPPPQLVKKDAPMYYTIQRNGLVKFWPPLTTEMSLMCKKGVV